MEIVKPFHLGKKILLSALGIFAFAALFVSCMDFFSTSMASWASRDKNKMVPPVTAGNVSDLVNMAENDPDLSLAVLQKIKDAMDNASGDDRQILQEAALTAAVNAVGLGQSVLGALEKLSSIGGDDAESQAKDTVLKAINDMTNLDSAGQALLDILPSPDSDEFDAFTAQANANDLALAAAVLLAGEAKSQAGNSENGMESYIDDVADRIESGDLNESERLAQALALAAALEGREDELSQPLKDVLSSLNLLKSGGAS